MVLRDQSLRLPSSCSSGMVSFARLILSDLGDGAPLFAGVHLLVLGGNEHNHRGTAPCADRLGADRCSQLRWAGAAATSRWVALEKDGILQRCWMVPQKGGLVLCGTRLAVGTVGY